MTDGAPDGAWTPTLVVGDPGAPADDLRVAAVMEVLGGAGVTEVAARRGVEPVLLQRWVLGFVEAGTARVTNRPEPAVAAQRDRFLAAFAHELRAPLASAHGWASMLEDGDVPPALFASTVAKLHDALGRLGERVRDVELLAAASLGLLRVDAAPVALSDLARDLPGHDAASVEARLVADADLFRRVLRDLWAAAHLGPTPRGVRLEAAPYGPWIDLRVVRYGDPIDPGVLAALFEPFDLNDDRTGVTIGLYLARALVVAHGGTLGLDQDEHRAVFWIRIPQPTHEHTTLRENP